MLVQGARQVGKTYAIENLLEKLQNVTKINLEKESNCRLEIDQTKTFNEFEKWLSFRFHVQDKIGTILYIDEAQESEKLGGYVRGMKEEWKHLKVILSGSSMSKLFREDTRIPVGRIKYLTVHPFSFREFLRFGNKENILEESKEKNIPDYLHGELLSRFDKYLLIGGMPEVVKAHYENKNFEDVSKNLIASQQDDFIKKEKIKSYLFIDALRGISNHIGFNSKLTHIASNHYDAKKIVQQLKEWFIIYEVEQKGTIPTQKFLPKRYLYDIGILRIIRETAIPRISVIETLDEKLRTPLGGLVENVVLLELLKGKSGYEPISSWGKNQKSNLEVDFIRKDLKNTIPIEVKATLKPVQKHYKSIIEYLKFYKQPLGYLVSFGKMEKNNIRENGLSYSLKNIPAYLIGEL